MKTMIWKELRENFKWALLALIGLAMAELYALSSGRNSDQFNTRYLTLLGPTILMVSAFGCAAIGAALGVLQILPELRRDQWAMLLHRPVSRSVIFFGKVAAGLLLYFFAVTLPFLASVAYVAVPGQFPTPLIPGMLLPGISDLLLGVSFYFAALLLCLHRGRWFGSRGCLGLAMVPLFVLHLSGDWSFLMPLVAAGVLALAAWGMMACRETGDPARARAGRINLIVVMLAGAEAGWLLLMLGLQHLPAKNSPVIFSSEFAVTKEGQVFLLKSNGSQLSLTDMDGKAVTDERYVGNGRFGNFLSFYSLAWDQELLGRFLRSGATRSSSAYFMELRNYDGQEVWYQLPRQNYFIGYDKLSRRCVGIFDRDGFHPAGTVPHAFPTPLKGIGFFFYTKSPMFCWSGPQLYAIDFSERSMIPFFNAGSDSIFGALNIDGDLAGDQPTPVAVALNDGIHLFDPQGKPLLVIPYGHDRAQWASLSLARSASADRFYVQYNPTYWDWRSNRWAEGGSVFLDEIDGRGNVLHSYSHPFTGRTNDSPGWKERLSTYSSPLLPALLGTLYYQVVPVWPELSSGMSYPRPALKVGRGDTAILVAVALGLGGIALAWARRVGFSGRRAGGWAFFVFCFGLPGLIAFRLAAKWPVRVPCPQCGVSRPIETKGCPACQRPWPLPSANGTEIFDGGKTAAEAGLG